MTRAGMVLGVLLGMATMGWAWPEVYFNKRMVRQGPRLVDVRTTDSNTLNLVFQHAYDNDLTADDIQTFLGKSKIFPSKRVPGGGDRGTMIVYSTTEGPVFLTYHTGSKKIVRWGNYR